MLSRFFGQSNRKFHIALLGAGISNLAAAEVFLRHGHRVTVYERDPSRLLFPAAPFDGDRFRYGGVFPDSVADADLVLRAPGLRPPADFLSECRRRSLTVTTEAGLFLALSPIPTYGVTGSDGKSTTATVAAALLRAAGVPTALVGNIGVPALPLIDTLTTPDAPRAAVVELSSFQLWDALAPPTFAAVTNITENHLDFHTDFAEYTDAKARILSGENPPVLPQSAPLPPRFPRVSDARLFDTAPLPPRTEGAYTENGCLYSVRDGKTHCLADLSLCLLVGEHNLKNLAAATALVEGQVPPRVFAEALPSLRPLPHRMELVRTVRGVPYIDSSIDSSPLRTESTLRAIGGRATVIVGGKTKGIPLTPLGATLARFAHAVVLLGEAAPCIEEILLSHTPFLEKTVPVCRARNMREAVRLAASLTPSGTPVVLSPACTSFDLYKNYAERGDAFCVAVRELEE